MMLSFGMHVKSVFARQIHEDCLKIWKVNISRALLSTSSAVLLSSYGASLSQLYYNVLQCSRCLPMADFVACMLKVQEGIFATGIFATETSVTTPPLSAILVKRIIV